jgi:hypothetical protein|tara:strand:- start:11027 stop:11347 length:321 start_codon:yes stop_codon:yes gene_type:complete
MKIISEYLFTGLFMWATLTAWFLGEYGAGFITLCMGTYFPMRSLANELLNAVDSWDINNKMKFMWGAMSMLVLISPVMLLIGNFIAFFTGLVGIGLIGTFDAAQKK